MFPFGLFFPTLYALLFWFVSYKFLTSYIKAHNSIALYFGISCFFYGCSVGIISLALFLFPLNSGQLALWGDTISRFLTLVGLSFMSINISYSLLPTIRPLFLFIVSLSFSFIGLGMMLYYPSSAFVSSSNYAVFLTAPQAIVPLKIQMIAISLPLVYAFFKEFIKKRVFSRAAFIMAGIALLVIFEPLTYDNLTLSSYLFFNFLSILGFAFLIGAFYLKQLSVSK